MRFMVKDVIELRDRSWVQRREKEDPRLLNEPGDEHEPAHFA